MLLEAGFCYRRSRWSGSPLYHILSDFFPYTSSMYFRYVKRLLESGETCEDLSGAAAASVSDALMDSVSNLLERQGSANVEKEKTALVKSVAGRLSTQPWISSHKSLGVEDVLVWRSLNVRGKVPAMPKTVTDWLARCTGDPLFREAADLLK